MLHFEVSLLFNIRLKLAPSNLQQKSLVAEPLQKLKIEMPSWLWGLEAVDKKFSLSCEEVFARQRVVLKISTGQSSRVLQGSVKLFPSFERLRDLSVLKDYWDLLSNSYVTCSVMPQHALCRDNL